LLEVGANLGEIGQIPFSTPFATKPVKNAPIWGYFWGFGVKIWPPNKNQNFIPYQDISLGHTPGHA